MAANPQANLHTLPDSAEIQSAQLPAAAAPIAGALKVSAVIPCLNEELTIGNCIAKVLHALAEMGVTGEVIVADNGSSDLSVEIARNLGSRVIHQPVRGHGAALRKGIEEARGEIIIMADADESYDWSAIAPFVRKIDEGYDLVMGNRFKGGIMPGAMPPMHRYLGNPVLSALARGRFKRESAHACTASAEATQRTEWRQRL